MKLIFLVDDDDAVRNSTRVLLEATGYSVRDFASADAFLGETEGREADCLILDYHLSDGTGMDLLELLRSRGVLTPAIVVSAGGPNLAVRATRAKVAAVLAKPLAADSLSQWLENLLR
jgi:FixJ family two-component response regulator